MTDHQAALLEAIRADPESDEPRLVFADWAEERGDLDRATFIRAQLRLASLPYWDSERANLTTQAARLLTKHKAGVDQATQGNQGPRVRFPSGFSGSRRL